METMTGQVKECIFLQVIISTKGIIQLCGIRLNGFRESKSLKVLVPSLIKSHNSYEFLFFSVKLPAHHCFCIRGAGCELCRRAGGRSASCSRTSTRRPRWRRTRRWSRRSRCFRRSESFWKCSSNIFLASTFIIRFEPKISTATLCYDTQK